MRRLQDALWSRTPLCRCTSPGSDIVRGILWHSGRRPVTVHPVTANARSRRHSPLLGRRSVRYSALIVADRTFRRRAGPSRWRHGGVM